MNKVRKRRSESKSAESRRVNYLQTEHEFIETHDKLQSFQLLIQKVNSLPNNSSIRQNLVIWSKVDSVVFLKMMEDFNGTPSISFSIQVDCNMNVEVSHKGIPLKSKTVHDTICSKGKLE